MRITLTLLLCALELSAQTNFPPPGVKLVVLPRSKETTWFSNHWLSYVKMAYLNGVRQWGNEIVDLRPARFAFETGEHEHHGFSLMAGRVLSVTPDGLLISLDTAVGFREKNVWLRNAPFTGKLVDGDLIAALGRKMPPFTYKSASGAQRTVEAYDCGEAPERRYLEHFNALAQAESEALALKTQQFSAAFAAKQQAENAAKQFASDAKVTAYYRKKAETGEAFGQYELALRLLAGKGAERDEAEAKRLLELAAKQGHAKAAEKLKTLP